MARLPRFRKEFILAACTLILATAISSISCSLYRLAQYKSPEQVVRLRKEKELKSSNGVVGSQPNHAVTGEKSIATGAYEMRMNQDFEGAIALLKSAIESDPNDAHARFELARIEFYTAMPPWFGGLGRAEKLIRKALKLDPTNERYHYWAGYIAGYRGIYFIHFFRLLKVTFEIKRAAKAFECAVALKPDFHAARLSLIQVLASTPAFLGGNGKRAKEHAEVLQRMDPVLGAEAACKAMEDPTPERKLEIWRALLEDHDTDPRIYMEIGQIYLSSAENLELVDRADYLEKALQNLSKAEELDPNSTKNLFKLARCYRLLGEHKTEIAYYEKILALEPTPPVHVQQKALRGLRGANMKIGNIARAEELAKTVKELTPYLCLVDNYDEWLLPP
ncbi:MAG: tetratricopeptide repeat protein [Candidatus Coatesbacteria bacterium]|nr:tetratricopeptide repeat protein [Candidatus Coatesbacteria bacterium]